MDDSQLLRAGLDYKEFVDVSVHSSLDAFMDASRPSRTFAFSTKGKSNYNDQTYQPGDTFIFGPETRGLPEQIRAQFDVFRIPMLANSRSLNLSNAVAIAIYEALRQNNFDGIG